MKRMQSILLTAVLFVSAGLNVMAEDLPVIAYWPFDSAAPLAEATGKASLTLTDQTQGHAVFVNNCLRLDGQQPPNSLFLGGLNLKQTSEGQPMTRLTVEFFIRARTRAAKAQFIMALYSYNDSGACDKGWFGFHTGSRTQATGNIKAFWHKGGRETDLSAGYELADGAWHHVAYVMDSTRQEVNQALLYVDGVLCTNGVQTTLSDIFPNGNFFIGKYGSGNAGAITADSNYGCTEGFEGELDDIRMTAAALTPDQFLTAPTLVGLSPPAGARAWVGAAGTANWSDAANWSGGQVPGAGDAVYLAAVDQVVFDLDTATPDLGEVVIDGTLRFANWNGKLKAASVTVGTNGCLTGMDSFNGIDTPSNRLWVACDDLTVREGGRIEMIGLGYREGRNGINSNNGYGPGKSDGSQENRAGAASHGGISSTAPVGAVPYGNAETPETAGSGGKLHTANDIAATAGGGVIRIDAAGTVRVDGEIRADAQDMMPYQGYGRACAGSGGSVLVNCRRICGSGVLSARGGVSSGNLPMSAPGGGGRIAVHYDSVVQTAEETAGLRFEVQAGKHYPYGYALQETGFFMYAGAGTLWFPDARLITAETLTNFRGRLVNVKSLTFDSDVTITNWVGFAEDGQHVTVNGHLTLSGPDARFEIGAVTQPSDKIQRRTYVSETPSALNVTGNFTVTDAARFDVYASKTNSVHSFGASVLVGGDFSVVSNAMVYPVSSPINGGSASFSVGNFLLRSGGTFGLAGGGWSGGCGRSGYGFGYGDGNFGAGYGGPGGHVVVNGVTNTVSVGRTYGNALRPICPGSGGGHNWNGQTGGGPGGGLIWIRASGAMLIDGTIQASGLSGTGYNNGSTAGSGGSILLEAKTISAGPSAQLLAKGGDSGATSLNAGRYTAGGGGGRIAVWSGPYEWTPSVKPSRYAVSEHVPAEWASFCDVSGGLACIPAQPDQCFAGENGTIRFASVGPIPGVLLIVQ